MRVQVENEELVYRTGTGEGTEGNVSIPSAQRSCVSLRANWFCAAGERGSASGSR